MNNRQSYECFVLPNLKRVKLKNKCFSGVNGGVRIEEIYFIDEKNNTCLVDGIIRNFSM